MKKSTRLCGFFMRKIILKRSKNIIQSTTSRRAYEAFRGNY